MFNIVKSHLHRMVSIQSKNHLLVPFVSLKQYSLWPLEIPYGRKWSTTLRTPGFKSKEIKVETSSEDTNIVKVHAIQESGDDKIEIKKSIHIPKEVDGKQLQVEYDRRGFLTLRAPYKDYDKPSEYDNLKSSQHSRFPWDSWGHIEQELEVMRHEMHDLIKHCFPESVRPEYSTNNDGCTTIKWDFDLHGYKPEEVTIRQTGHVISVEAKHEDKKEQTFRQFKQIFTMPENVIVDEMRSKFLKNGELRLEVPCKKRELTNDDETIFNEETIINEESFVDDEAIIDEESLVEKESDKEDIPIHQGKSP